jgi:hypothetical protein
MSSRPSHAWTINRVPKLLAPALVVTLQACSALSAAGSAVSTAASVAGTAVTTTASVAATAAGAAADAVGSGVRAATGGSAKPAPAPQAGQP